jgi:hypothetical protein
MTTITKPRVSTSLRLLTLVIASAVIALCNVHYVARMLKHPELEFHADFRQTKEAMMQHVHKSALSHVRVSSVSDDSRDPKLSVQNQPTMNILCTSASPNINFGSYKLRCLDFATWAKQCAGSTVNITTGIEIDDVLMQPQIYRQYHFDATIIIKIIPTGSTTRGLPSWLGKIFIDMVDNYKVKPSWINPQFSLILQTKRQREMFPKHNYRVVEHWYNSYPADMARGDELPEYVPSISQSKQIRLATVWSLKPFEGYCPSSDGIENISYDCIVQNFEIDEWYSNVVSSPDTTEEVSHIMSDPMLGRGKLYYNLFQKYDVMVALAKNNTYKLQYGNVQRIVSQMRSGVPVLVEVWGPVLKEFVDRYNYTCAFQRFHVDPSSYLSFEEAVEMMKDPGVRRECQSHGLSIAKDFSPNTVGKKLLKAVGFKGKFEC